MTNLFRHELFSRWRAILGWGIGLSLFSAMYILIYPEMMGELEGLADLSIYQAMGIDMASFAGFIASVVVQIIPLILGAYVIVLSTGTLAGEEESGTLELLVAMPLKRWQIVAMKAAALSIVLFLVLVITGAGSALSLAIVRQTTEVDVTPLQLFGALLSAFPLMLSFLAIGMFLGATVPNRRLATAVLVLVYLGSYLLESLAGMVSSLDPVKPLSLFTYFNSTASLFTEGVAAGDVIVLLVVSLVFFGLTVLSFQRRSITVGQWSWQQGRAPAG
jgi:ABC-2 type transport system permease protein